MAQDSKSFNCPDDKVEKPPSSTLKKKATDQSGMSKERKKTLDKLTPKEKAEKKITGVFGTKRAQAMIKREDVESEKIVGRGPDNNAFIVIGNDRTGKPHTGYGGKGHTQSDAIDLVAGMSGPNPKEVDGKGNEVKTNPNFFIDAARIYISQKTDVDKNFGIGEFGKTQKNVDKDSKDAGKYGGKSAVVAKADNIRIIGRESIRLVTGTDGKNSQGGDVLTKSGIEIISMNKTESLQPMVLGDNLLKCFERILQQISAIAKTTHGYTKYQMKMNKALADHIHNSPFFALPTSTSVQAQAGNVKAQLETSMKTELSILKQLTNMQGIRANYLVNSGDNFVLSELNKVN
tara:strand:- start:44 stop:1084 length:1041 start_codon:yes stop_codon:yes gene_type:complete